jgi:hypothetical protein
VAGERLATDKRQSSVNGAEKCSLYAAPLPGSNRGGGGSGRRSIASFGE